MGSKSVKGHFFYSLFAEAATVTCGWGKRDDNEGELRQQINKWNQETEQYEDAQISVAKGEEEVTTRGKREKEILE